MPSILESRTQGVHDETTLTPMVHREAAAARHPKGGGFDPKGGSGRRRATPAAERRLRPPKGDFGRRTTTPAAGSAMKLRAADHDPTRSGACRPQAPPRPEGGPAGGSGRAATTVPRAFAVPAAPLLFVVLLLVVPLHGLAGQARLGATLDSLRAAFGVPGLIAAWSGPDGEVTELALGSTRPPGDGAADPPPEMPPSGRMLAASIGKSFVAATALALAGEGVLALDAPVARWVGDRPWFARLAHGEAITLRHLLTHGAGLVDHVHHPDFAGLWAARRAEGGTPPPDALIGLVAGEPPLFRPGEGWSYSDTGYLIVGLVVEAATGRALFDEVRRRFLDPLGLDATTPSDTPVLPGLVPGWVDPANPFGLPRATLRAPGVMAWDPAVEGAGGGLASRPADLVRWGRALFTGAALTTPYLHEMHQAVPTEPGSTTTLYGAGVAIRRGGPFGPVVGHAGSIPGYLSALRHYPRHGVTLALQLNGDGPFRAGPGAGAGSAGAGEVMAALEAALAAGLMADPAAPPGG